MATELLDILDSAVKIGLGALISGVATYLVSRQRHKAETHKELLVRKMNNLEKAISRVNEYIFFLDTYLAEVDGFKRANASLTEFVHGIPERIDKFDLDILRVRQSLREAESIFGMLALSDLAQSVEGLRSLEKDIRLLVIFEMKVPDDDVFKKWCDDLDKAESEFYRRVSHIYAI